MEVNKIRVHGTGFINQIYMEQKSIEKELKVLYLAIELLKKRLKLNKKFLKQVKK